jgi:hypothetical protein
MKTRRRNVLLGAGAIAAVGSLPAPAIAQGIKELKLVSAYPKPAKPEPNRDFERTSPSAVRAIFG